MCNTYFGDHPPASSDDVLQASPDYDPNEEPKQDTYVNDDSEQGQLITQIARAPTEKKRDPEQEVYANTGHGAELAQETTQQEEYMNSDAIAASHTTHDNNQEIYENSGAFASALTPKNSTTTAAAPPVEQELYECMDGTNVNKKRKGAAAETGHSSDTTPATPLQETYENIDELRKKVTPKAVKKLNNPLTSQSQRVTSSKPRAPVTRKHAQSERSRADAKLERMKSVQSGEYHNQTAVDQHYIEVIGDDATAAGASTGEPEFYSSDSQLNTKAAAGKPSVKPKPKPKPPAKPSLAMTSQPATTVPEEDVYVVEDQSDANIYANVSSTAKF